MESSIFVVNKEPFCIWEKDVGSRNVEFLDGIDPDYFSYLADIYSRAEDKKRSAIAMRAALYHALETLFSLIGSYVQAPDCAYAWIAKCTNNQLRNFVTEVSSTNNSLFTKLNIRNVSWGEIAENVFSGYIPNTEKNKRTSKLFAELWNKLAIEFLNEAHVDEYNSIKHGFRVRSGGFTLAIGIEREFGVSPPQNKMQTIGHSEYGTSILKLEKLTSNNNERSYRSKRHSLNWSIEKTTLLLQLAAMSINNLLSALRISNGVAASSCKFVRPSKDSDFALPWDYTTGVTISNIDHFFQVDKSMLSKKSQLQDIIKNYMESRVDEQ
ncbi:hypothetical protein [Alteromonas macleodii]|uniref:hypothetical protein n=1 Tax=Alteromonas macleodii TaxID=28108 RepID=UPI002FE1D33D